MRHATATTEAATTLGGSAAHAILAQATAITLPHASASSRRRPDSASIHST